MAEEWRPDVLGEPFEQLTLPLGEDGEGPVVATIVRSLAHHSVFAELIGDRRALHDVDVLVRARLVGLLLPAEPGEVLD